jgi:hypothetical protein
MRNRFFNTYQAQFAKIVGFSSGQAGGEGLARMIVFPQPF